VAKIAENAEYQRLCKEHEDLQFDAERDVIERAKRRIEVLLDQPFQRSEQVRAALVELRKKRNDRHRDLYFDLIMMGYQPRWTDTQKAYFANAWRLIQSTHDFFFSFTMRHTPPDVENPVNSDYKYFIKEIVGAERFETADRCRTNLLAKAVHAWLSRSLYRGFIFTEHQGDNAVTLTKLREHCRQSLVFVQMIQNIMFDEPGERTNYCLFEYVEAKQAIIGDPEGEKRFLFIVAEESRDHLPRSFLVPEEYEEWYDHLLAKDPVYLPRLPVYSDQKIDEFKRLLDEKIRDKLSEAWEWVFRGVPE
jgi:hypothetical protein